MTIITIIPLPLQTFQPMIGKPISKNYMEIGPAQEKILEELNELEVQRNENVSLDCSITESDILNAAKKQKNRKSSYSDKISNEMIKHSVPILLHGYYKLFNLVLEYGTFPEIWCEGLITPIFKSGDKSDNNNYRGICVTSCLNKFFCTILNERLKHYVKENDLIHQSQIGFQSGHRTADHILTLKTLLDKKMNTNRNDKVYACFIDFKKAFDSVWHQGLLFKLLKNKIDGKLYSLIKSLQDRTSFLTTREYARGVY